MKALQVLNSPLKIKMEQYFLNRRIVWPKDDDIYDETQMQNWRNDVRVYLDNPYKGKYVPRNIKIISSRRKLIQRLLMQRYNA